MKSYGVSLKIDGLSDALMRRFRETKPVGMPIKTACVILLGGKLQGTARNTWIGRCLSAGFEKVESAGVNEISTHIPRDLRDALQLVARARGISLKALVRIVLTGALELGALREPKE